MINNLSFPRRRESSRRLFRILAYAGMTMLMLFAGTSAHATPPCNYLDEFSFNQKVFQPASAVVYGQVVGHSRAREDRPEKWTKLLVKDVLFARSPEHTPPLGQVLTIRSWQSDDIPLYTYAIGDHIVAFLVLAGADEAVLTYNEWSSCAPAVWSASIDGRAVPKYREGWGRQSSWLPVSLIQEQLKEWQ